MFLYKFFPPLLIASGIFNVPSSCSGPQPTPAPEIPAPPTPVTEWRQDREPLPLARMICMADVIAYGIVESIGAGTYRFRTEMVVWGEPQGGALNIEQFIPNKFDGPRAVPYEVGQQFLLFLQYDSLQTRWKVLGAGGEGELPVEEGYVYFPGRYMEGLERKRYTVQNVAQEMSRYEHDVFLTAVKDFKACFVYKYNATDARPVHLYQRRCPDETIKQWQDATFMHRYLMHNMR